VPIHFGGFYRASGGAAQYSPGAGSLEAMFAVFRAAHAIPFPKGRCVPHGSLTEKTKRKGLRRGLFQGLPSGSHRIDRPSKSTPQGGRGWRPVFFGAANRSSRRKKHTTSIPRKGIATRNVSRPEPRIASCIARLRPTEDARVRILSSSQPGYRRRIRKSLESKVTTIADRDWGAK
jgi:hypothetical protein